MRHVGSDGLTHKTEKSLSHESSLAIHRLFDPGLECVADQTGYQPTQRDVLLLGDSAEVAQKIVGQDNDDFGIGVQCKPPSAISRRHSDGVQRVDKGR